MNSVRWVFTMWLLVLFPCKASAERVFAARNVSDTPRILAMFADLVSRSILQGGKREEAAFLVLDEAGEFKCYLWPRAGRLLRQTYDGPLPAGTVAIAHTHPQGHGEKPSAADVIAARTTRLPVFVLTWREIYAFDPATGETLRVNRKLNWPASIERGPSACVLSTVWRREISESSVERREH